MDNQKDDRFSNIDNKEKGACDCGNDHSSCNDPNCNCDHNHDHELHNAITLELEDGSELVCPVIDLFEVSGREYIALLHPIEETALLYRFFDYEDGTVALTDFEEEGEYDLVTERFLALQKED